MKMRIKNILLHKIAASSLVLSLIVIAFNPGKFYYSITSFYYFLCMLFSRQECGSNTMFFIEYWAAGFYLLFCTILSVIVISKKYNLKEKAGSFFLKKIAGELHQNKTLRAAVITVCLVVSAGFLAPFISPNDPYEISAVSVTKYLPPFSSAKYINHEEVIFSGNSFYYADDNQDGSDKLIECRKYLNPKFNKIYFDSLKLDENRISLFQGTRIKNLPAYTFNLGGAKIEKDYFILGTDSYGRDILSRMIYGTRISLGIAIIAVCLSLLLGLILGLISGYFGGLIDTIIMRTTDIFLSFPVIFLLLLIVAFFGNSFFYIALFIGLTTWMDISRLTRAQVITAKKETYILSAKAAGFSSFRILYHHLLPNIITPVIVNTAFKIGIIILMESGLSFLGLGVNEPIPSWGSIINSGKDSLLSAWWISLFPGLTITTMVILFNYIGDNLRRIVKIK